MTGAALRGTLDDADGRVRRGRQRRHDERRRGRPARRGRRRVRRAGPVAARRRRVRPRRAVRTERPRTPGRDRARRQLRRRPAQVAVRPVRLRCARSTASPTLGGAAHSQHGAYLDARRPQRVEPVRLRLPPDPPRPRAAAVVLAGHLRDRRLRRRASRPRSPPHAAFAQLAPRRDRVRPAARAGPVGRGVHACAAGRRSSTTAWSRSRAKAGVALIVPTTWAGEVCLRICIVDPRTTLDQLARVLDDMAAADGGG